MVKRWCRDVFVISRKWLGVFWNISKNRGLLKNFVDCGLITKKPRGLFANFPG
jgi:hypothetical protein